MSVCELDEETSGLPSPSSSVQPAVSMYMCADGRSRRSCEKTSLATIIACQAAAHRHIRCMATVVKVDMC
jgi:hypothetical protein